MTTRIEWFLIVEVLAVLVVVVAGWLLKGAADPLSMICMGIASSSLGFCVAIARMRHTWQS